MGPARALLASTAAAGVAVVVAASPALALTELTLVGATFDRTGQASVTLSTGCTQTGESVYFSATLRQPLGRTQSIHGWGDGSAVCTNGTATATVRVSSYEGTFRGGTALVSAYASGDCVVRYNSEWDYYYPDCEYLYVPETAVQLSRAR